MTTATVQMLFQEPVVQEFGVVLARMGKKARVGTKSGEADAHIAASCLLSPAVGDRVLVARAGEEAYVLSVLTQRGDEARLVFDRDVSFSVLQGKLRILAQEGVDVVSPNALKVEVGKMETSTKEASMAFTSLEIVGQSLLSKTKKVRVLAETLDTVAGRIYERAVNFLRRTDELDRVEAKHIERRAEHLVHIHGENAITTAEHLVKIDAGQVHVG
jgi:hypothetical protein